MKMEELKSGAPATAYHFSGNLGHPVATQDPVDELYFFQIDNRNFHIRKVQDTPMGSMVELITVQKFLTIN